MTVSWSVSLADASPELARYFNEKRNGFPAKEITSMNPKKVWWNCDKNPEHEWEAAVADRVGRGRGCPFCAGRRVSSDNNLEFLAPDIAKMFDASKNGMTAKDIIATSTKKWFWMCPNGHSFSKSAYETIRTKGNCKECDSLAYNHPELRRFYHESNKDSFDSLFRASNKKVLWKCDSGHEYKMVVGHKTLRSLGCPFCSGRYATKENNLADAYPEIVKEFDAEKTGKQASDFTPKSNILVWWKCEAGHSYKISPAKKTREDLPYGCPFCSGYQIDHTNSLESLFPAIAKEFRSDLNGVTPDKIPTGVSKAYKWECVAGHIFKSSVSDRTRRGTGCGYCSGRHATPQNNFAVIRPDEVKHFHPTKNGTLTPFDITPKSNKKIHWICSKNHEWVAAPSAKMGCPKCSMSATSKVEKELRKAVSASKIFTNVPEHGTRLSILWRKNKTMTVDILADAFGKKVAIEYDGYYYHSGIRSKDPAGALQKDAQKTQALLDSGYYVIRVREQGFNGKLADVPVTHQNLLQVSYSYRNRVTGKRFDGLVSQMEDWIRSK